MTTSECFNLFLNIYIRTRTITESNLFVRFTSFLCIQEETGCQLLKLHITTLFLYWIMKTGILMDSTFCGFPKVCIYIFCTSIPIIVCNSLNISIIGFSEPLKSFMWLKKAGPNNLQTSLTHHYCFPSNWPNHKI